MQIDKNNSFGMLEPLMIDIFHHIKEDPDPETNGQRYNVIWSKIHSFIKENKLEISFQFSKED